MLWTSGAFLAEMVDNPKVLKQIFDDASVTMKPVALWRKINAMGAPAREAIQALGETEKVTFYKHLSKFEDDLHNFASIQSDEIDAIGCWNAIKGKVDELEEGAEAIEKVKFLLADLKHYPELVEPFKGNVGLVEAWETAFTRNLPTSWRTNPRFLEAFKKVIDDVHLDDHIRKGHPVTRSDGSISGIKGVHHKDAVTVAPGQSTFNQGDVRIKPNTKNPSNAGPDDLYEAEPEIYGLNKSTNPPTPEWRKKNGGGGKSTFYPDGWSKEKIQNEISFVREKITASDFDAANGWYSTWNSEGTFKIAMYVDDLEDLSSGIGSAFPLLP